MPRTSSVPDSYQPMATPDARRSLSGNAQSDALLRGAVVFGLFGIALIHFLDLFAKFDETPYLGFVYLALIAACLVVAFALVQSDDTRLYALAGGLAAVTFAAYAISRTVGLPAASDDIGNWTESLGLASLFTEGLVMILSGYALALSSTSSRPSSRAAIFDT